jgi:hypothetical protein
LKKRGDFFFRDIADKLNLRMVAPLPHHAIYVTVCLGVVCSCDDQLRLRELWGNTHERINDRFQALVRPPFSKSQNPMVRVSALRKIRIFGTSGKNAVTPHVHRSTTIFFADQTAISGEQNGDGIGKQQQLCRNKSRCAVRGFEANARVFQVHGFHQLMKRDVRVDARHAGDGGNGDTDERRQWLAAEAGKSKIEPNYVGLLTANFAQQSPWIRKPVERPAAHDVVAVEFGLRGMEIIPEDGEFEAFRVL